MKHFGRPPPPSPLSDMGWLWLGVCLALAGFLALSVLGQELTASTLFSEPMAMSLAVDVTIDCGLVNENLGLPLPATRLIHSTERVHWGAPILAHDIVDKILLCGGELRRHRPKLCGGSWGELVAFDSRCQAGVLEPKWKRKRRHPETSAGTYRSTWASWLSFTCLR